MDFNTFANWFGAIILGVFMLIMGVKMIIDFYKDTFHD